MALRDKKLDQVQEEALTGLVDDEFPEGKEIEYKEQLPTGGHESKHEFLADVSSFANCTGGDLVYGIKERRDAEGRPTGIPAEVVGVDADNVDAEVLRLENMIRDGIQPRIIGVAIHAVHLSNSKQVLIVRVPKSWMPPHMVTYQGSSRFYSRNSRGKYPLDVGEIRAAILGGEHTIERVRNFRLERLALIISNEGPVPLPETAKIVLHIVPLRAFEPGMQFDLNGLMDKLKPIYAFNWNHRYNFDGVLSYSFVGDRTVVGYLQIFRNGIIEAVDTLLLEPKPDAIIPSIIFEQELIKAVNHHLRLQEELGVDPPLLLMLTLVGVKGYQMAVNRSRYRRANEHPIDRDTLAIPEVLIQEYRASATDLLKPCFDAVWNAAGWPRSMNYSENGE